MMARIEESAESGAGSSRQTEIISESERLQLQHDWFAGTQTKRYGFYAPGGGAHLRVNRRQSAMVGGGASLDLAGALSPGAKYAQQPLLADLTGNRPGLGLDTRKGELGYFSLLKSTQSPSRSRSALA